MKQTMYWAWFRCWATDHKVMISHPSISKLTLFCPLATISAPGSSLIQATLQPYSLKHLLKKMLLLVQKVKIPMLVRLSEFSFCLHQNSASCKILSSGTYFNHSDKVAALSVLCTSMPNGLLVSWCKPSKALNVNCAFLILVTSASLSQLNSFL